MSGGDDWQVGDLALCVADRLPPPRDKPTKLLRVGAVYTVNSVRWSVGEQCIAIGLVEVRSKGPCGDWHSAAFRKIRPLSPEEHRDAILELAADQRRSVPATAEYITRYARFRPAVNDGALFHGEKNV